MLEGIRSSTNVNAGDSILIRYAIDLQAVEKQYEEMERKVAESTGWAGPTPSTQLSPAGLLRESVLHRYAQSCNVVRGRLLIDQ